MDQLRCIAPRSCALAAVVLSSMVVDVDLSSDVEVEFPLQISAIL
jgi:hypothetical protein